MHRVAQLAAFATGLLGLESQALQNQFIKLLYEKACMFVAGLTSLQMYA